MQKKMLRDLLEKDGGTGKNYEIPPKNFREEVTDEKERKKIFSEVVREKMKLSQKYQDWLGQNCCLLPSAFCLIPGKIIGEKKKLLKRRTIKSSLSEKGQVEKISLTLRKL